jgi:hypothetical protein
MATRLLLLFLLVSVTLMSCEIEEQPAKALPPFRTITSNGSVTYKLVDAVENTVISTSLDESGYNVTNGSLSVNAVGGTMTVGVRNLRSLWCNSCSVESNGLVTDTLIFSIHAGSMKLYNVQVNHYLGLNAVNTGRYRLSGHASFFNFSTVNLATVEAYNLVTDSTYVNTTSIGYAEVNATHVLNVFINSIGGVYYKGNPPVVRATITGIGGLVKKD